MGDPVRQVLDAMDAVARVPHTSHLQRSNLYWTPPWGDSGQAFFVNAAVGVDTQLSPHQLLDALLDIESQAGRVRDRVNGPRTLDLDLLLVEGMECHDEHLILPHPRMMERAFVLLPLHDIAPELALTATRTVAQQLALLDLSGCERIM